MKKIITLFMLFVIAMSGTACENLEAKTTITQYPHNWINQSHSLIAHGGGAIDGHIGTNVRDAVIRNYEAGHRVFEIDLNLTTDGAIVAVHDWPSYKGPLSAEEFSKIKIADRYQSMSFDDLCLLMSEYPDLYVVTDTKSFEYTEQQVILQFKEICRIAGEYTNEPVARIVPQIYNQRMYDIIMDVYPFSSVIYTLYESPDTDDEVVEFVRDKDAVKAITMAPSRLSPGFVRKLRECGKVVYLFTLNDEDEMFSYKKMGVTGFYTDFVTPYEGLFGI